AHEKERVAGALRLMHRDFSGRQAKDYVAAVIDARQLEHVAEESQVGLGLRAADDAMCTDEHRNSSFSVRLSPSSGGNGQVPLSHERSRTSPSIVSGEARRGAL